MPIVTKQCQSCGKSFTRSLPPKRAKAIKACSRSCASKLSMSARWSHHRGSFTCLTCGRVVTTNLFRAQRQQYCSPGCWLASEKHKAIATGNLPKLSGENHPRWRGGRYPHRIPISLRKEIFGRDGWKCCACGNLETKMDAHHAIPWRFSNDDNIDNFVTLCASCHTRLEFLLEQVTKDFLVTSF